MDNIIHSREGVIQGYPLAMLAYVIGIISLIKCLKSIYPDVTQPWYTDSAGVLGMFNHLEKYFRALKCNGPAQGYFPNTTKRILLVHLKKPDVVEGFG